jgi:hypothetical protein
VLTTKFSVEQRSELQDPSPHPFVGNIQTALRKQIFVAAAECNTDVSANRLPENLVAANERVVRHPSRRTEVHDGSFEKAVKRRCNERKRSFTPTYMSIAAAAPRRDCE